MLSSDRKTQLAIVGATTIVMMLLVWLAAPSLTTWHRGQMAKQLAEQVAASKDSAVKVPLRQLASLGDPALGPLVIAASSQRATVSTIARQIIDEKLAAWRLLAEASAPQTVDRDVSNSTARLATTLAVHIDKFGPAGKRWVERLALALIELADTLPAQQSGTLLADCSEILASVPPRGPRLRTVTSLVEPNATRSPSALPAPQPRLEPLTQASEGSLEILARLRPTTSLEYRGRIAQGPPPETEAVVTETKLPASGLNWSKRRDANVQKPPTNLPVTTLEAIQGSPNRQPDSAKNRVTDIPTPQDMRIQTTTLRQLATVELLVRLHSARFYEAGVLHAVLKERGFTDAELALMQRLASPEVADRLRLVEDASTLPAAAARHLLQRLIDDKNADVRLRALTALATTNAPNLYELARELAVSDEDPRVAELASRLLRQVR